MRRLLVLSGGHPYQAEPFAALFASFAGWSVTHLIHPEAEVAVTQGATQSADAILFYDMPGYTFADGRVAMRPPSDAFKSAICNFFARGGGAVALHHALAGWSQWPEWSEMLGGRFLYQPGEVRGTARLDSGYRHEVPYTAEVLGDHPVTAGLPRQFPLIDELYLAEIFADEVTPLLRAKHDFVAPNFYSAAQAVAGTMFSNAGWNHPPGSDLIGWTKAVTAGRLVYLQPGDGPAAYADPHYRQLLAQALEWVVLLHDP